MPGSFSFCYNMYNITISSSVTSIGAKAFYNCYELREVFFTGSEADWAAITFADSDSDPSTRGVVYYNCILCPTHGATSESECPSCGYKPA